MEVSLQHTIHADAQVSALTQQLEDQRLLTKMMEGRYNRSHQDGLDFEMRAVRAEAAHAAAREEALGLAARIADLETKISTTQETING